MTPERRSFTLDSTLDTVDNAEQAANEIATQFGFNEEEVLQIAMAVREAAVNVITIRDQGKGLDPSKIPDPLAPENLLKTSGRGIFLIRSFMDDVQINPSASGTEIKLIKHVHGPAADGKEASQ
jgi:serine/threonine-protein kinase RsbW